MFRNSLHVLSEAQEDIASEIKYHSDGEEKRGPRALFNVMTKFFKNASYVKLN